MKNMPNITLTRRELKRLLKHSVYSHGGESIVCNPSTGNTLYKLMAKRGKILPMSENKERKVKRLHELQLEDSTIPVATISYKGNLIGYEMTFDEDDVRYSPTYQGRKEKIEFLDETSRILRYFATKDIVYGDVAYRNILYNKRTGKYKFCDMDNIKLEDYPIDLVGRTTPLSAYADIRGVDANADAYVHNILVFETLGVDFPYYFEGDIDLDFEEPGIQIIDSMIEPETFTGDYVIQYVKRR